MSMNKRKKQAIAWMFVWIVVLILPFFTWKYLGTIVIIWYPFALFLLIKLIWEFMRGDYDYDKTH